jgi:outer membrane protein assembly factor BamB
MPTWKLCRTAALALAATPPLWSAAHAARADVLDPSIPRVVVVGAPRGAAPSERLDPQRTGRARGRLPASPVELWRRHMSANVDLPPVVDDAGDVLVALTIPDLVALGPDGKELWRARLGSASPTAPPVLLADGTAVVVTAAGVAWGVRPGGAVRFSTPLGVRGRDADTAPLALADGGVLVAAGSALVELDADGVVRARGVLEDRAPGASSPTAERAAGGLVETASGALVTTEAGNVYRFHPPAPPRRIGSFGGSTRRGAALADERTLMAVADGRRLVALDLATGLAHVRTSGFLLDAPPAIGAPPLLGPLAFVTTQAGGVLLGVDAAGNEKFHATLERASAAPAGLFGLPGSSGLAGQPDAKPSPPCVVDPVGRVGFVRANGRVGTVSPEGRVDVAAERVCTTPVAVAPAGEKRMLVACHDGGLWMYGE